MDQRREAAAPRSSSATGAVGHRPSDEGFEILDDLSRLLQTGLTRSELKACINLLQQGQSADGLAKVVQDLRAEAEK
ncbi:hypothetical protein BDZ90DRAFT_262338 [Jaminaea rosea]|uniref:Mitotic-spindle organizing protein 1 n=1 Tax=Jaminaea rosea TaxID=1569628 RepID=A0A316UJ80_9BASI|nr:hypothetical protein BDZ90DRAFT_262338 [Jaminaea rosea]PWN25280.1 hypothetical protein BDZ90DRAFT_262338 [Jaminaea rosea]